MSDAPARPPVLPPLRFLASDPETLQIGTLSTLSRVEFRTGGLLPAGWAELFLPLDQNSIFTWSLDHNFQSEEEELEEGEEHFVNRGAYMLSQ